MNKQETLDILFKPMCKLLLEKDDAKQKGWVWDYEKLGWFRVIKYEFLKQTSKRNPNKYTDKCKVTLESVENENANFTKNVMDYNGDYFSSYKKNHTKPSLIKLGDICPPKMVE